MAASASVAPEVSAARPRARGLPVLAATLRESQALISAAGFYILAIGLLVGLLLPAFKTLNLGTYFSGSLGAIIGTAGVPPAVTFASYLALELYSSIFLLLFGGVMAFAAGGSIARNIEDGTIDITLARPISRTRFYLEKWGALIVGSVLLVGISIFTGWLDTVLFDGATLDWPSFLLAQVDIGAIFFCVVGVGLLISAGMSAGRAAGGAATVVVVVMYLAQTFGTAADRLGFLKFLSPYYYAPAANVMITQHWDDAWKVLVPVAAGLVAALVGLVLFQRRDITV